MSALKEVLSRCVTDGAFLEHLQSRPDEALRDYDLSPRQREILRARDGRLLELLGEVHDQEHESEPGTPQDAEAAREESPRDESPSHERPIKDPARPTPLKPADIAVRLVPYASREGDGSETAIRLTYATHVDAVPDDVPIGDLPAPPLQTQYGVPLPTLAVRITVRPVAVTTDGGDMISFEVDATVPPTPVAAPAEEPSRSARRRSLVGAVHAATTDTRMARLLDLIEELRQPPEGEASA